MVVSVAALQFPIGGPVTLEDKLHLFRRRPDFVCLPEYFTVQPDAQGHGDGAGTIAKKQSEFSRLSRDLQCVLIAGTMAHPIPGGYANMTTIFDRGAPAGTYQKVNPFGREEQRGIIAGTEYKVFSLDGVRIGVLICADVLNPDAFHTMKRLGADIVFVPTVSPFRENDTVFEKERRDAEIFVAGAQRARTYVVKTCGTGTLFGGQLQGRSGIFAPWGILNRVPPDGEDRKLVLTATLDLDEIREFKRLMALPELAGERAPVAHPVFLP